MSAQPTSAFIGGIRLPVGPGIESGDTPLLRVGQTAVVRVLSAPSTGQGMLSLAGRAIAAQLPAGVQPGQRLVVSVREVSPQQVVLELVKADVKADSATAGRAQLLSRLAGELALVRDPAAFAAALALAQHSSQAQQPAARPYAPASAAASADSSAADVPVPSGQAAVQAAQQPPPAQAAFLLELPGQRRAELDLDQRADGGRPLPDGASARIVLHGKRLGPVELTIWLDDQRAQVHVTGDPQAVAALREHQPLLEQALRDRLNRPAFTQVSPRAADAVRPVDPEGFTAYG